MNKKAIVLFVLGFMCAMCAYSLWPYLWKGAFYQFVSIAFVGYVGATYFLSKGNWSLAIFVVWMTTINSCLDEFFFDPTEMDYNEYFAFVLLAIITIKYKDKWIR